MFFRRKHNIAIFLTIAVLVLCANLGMTQTEWKKNLSNPVIDLGNRGTWDDNHAFSPTILFDGMEYHMWYSGHDGLNYRIGYAISSDGINWVKHSNNPVLDLGNNGAWDDRGVSRPTVLFDGIEYHMWYTGYNGEKYRIGYR